MKHVLFFLLVLTPFLAFAGCPPQTTMMWRQYRVIGNVSGGGVPGGGVDLSDAPFVTWDFNGSLTNETPIWALTRSVVPAPALNASLYLGNATSYWLAVNALTGYFPTLCLNGDCRTLWPPSTGEIYNGTFNETEGKYVYNLNPYRIDFNETKLNETIDSRLSSTTYYPAAYNVDAGTETGGNLASLFYYDGDTLNVTEAGGIPPVLSVVVNFTGVTTFDWLLIRERYGGGGGHEVYVQIYNFIGSVWDTYYLISDQADLVSLPPLYVADASEHISATNVSMRFYHINNGNANHKFYVDFVQLLDGFSTTTTITHDSLSSRNLDINHLQYLNRNATRTLSSDWNVGFFAIYNLSHLNATNANFTGNVTANQYFATGQGFANVYLSAAQTVNSTDADVILFDTEIDDVQNEYDVATGVFTAREDGVYSITCAAMVNGTI